MPSNLLYPSPSIYVDAKTQFGAKGDGITDDTKAIQNAIDSVAGSKSGGVVTGGGTVFLPPAVYKVSTLTMKHRVDLVGGGHGGTIVSQISGTTGPVITNTSHTQVIGIRDLKVYGDKTAASASAHGIYFDTFTTLDTSVDEYNDPRYYISGVQVENCSGDGIRLTGRGASIVANCWVYNVDGYGLNLSLDSHIYGVDAGISGKTGFYLGSSGGECRIVGCKSWYSGRVDLTGHGFYVNTFAGLQIVGCSAQDNQGAGFMFDGAGRIVGSGLFADSNNTAGTGRSGFEFNNAYTCNIQGFAFDRGANTNHQLTCLKFTGGSNTNVVNLTYDSGNSVIPISASSTNNTSNYITINGTPLNTTTVQSIATSGTVTVTGGVARLTHVSGAVTGIILPVGTYPGQMLTVINEAATSVTFAASGTSNVAQGTSDVIPATTARLYVWDDGTSLWYHAG